MSKLSFYKVEIENFRSIKDKVTLDIKPGLFSIEGVNNSEVGSLNGAGKSSIISALYWCLTGNALTNEVLADEVINSLSGKNCRVSVYIHTEIDNIKITRTRKDSEFGNNLILEINDQDLSCHKISDTQERINQIIKLPLDLLKNTLMITCNMDSAFSELTPAQRVQILENIRDYTIWNNVRDNANKDIKNYNKSIKELELEISNLSGSKSSFSQVLLDTEKDKKNCINDYKEKNYPKIIENIDTSIKTIETQINELNKQKDELQSQIVSSSNNTLLDEINKIKDEGFELNKQLNTVENNKKNYEQEINFKKRELLNNLSVINSWFTNDTCPTCKRKLERTEKQIEEKNIEKKSLEIQINNCDEILVNVNSRYEKAYNETKKKIEEKREKYSELNTLYQNKLKEAEIIPNKIKLLDEQLKELSSRLTNEINNKQHAQNAINNYNIRLAAFDENLIKYKKQVEDIDNQMKIKDTSLKEFEDKRKISNFFYELLGPKGELRPYLLKQDLEYLNIFVQHYISRFFTGTNVKLVLENNNINIVIDTTDGIKKTISSLSGGEKKRVNLAIQLALYDLMQSVSQSGFNILCLDEVETQMDPLGCQQLIDIINDKSNEIETVYWITNNDMVKENIVNKIICVKTNGITTIKEV